MSVSLAVVLLALRAGLGMRRRRLQGLRPKPDLIRRHLALAKPGVTLVLIGLVGGVVSSVWLRGWEPLASFHSWLGIASALLFVVAATLGRRAGRGREEAARHGLLGLFAVLMALVAMVAGFVLLP
jgi:hypothetical protein